MEERRFGMRWYWIALFAIIIFSILPMISGIGAATIAESNGCILNEGSSHPCLVGGVDLGDALYTMGVLTWLMFATFPIGFCLFVAWVAVLVIHRLVWGRQHQGTDRP